MVKPNSDKPAAEMKTSRQFYDESIGIRRQTDDGRHRLSEDDQ